MGIIAYYNTKSIPKYINLATKLGVSWYHARWDNQEKEAYMVVAEKKGRSKGIMLPNLKKWRERRGLSQRELEEKSGVGHDRISLLETGKSGAQGRTVRKLANALGVETEDLVG
jgi:DNA-binding XRE family transcriptional regulator